jgi:hypothetical protein
MDEKCAVHNEQIKQLQNSDTDQWDHINKIEAALHKLIPVWLTILMMVMSALTGSALTFAGMIIKFAGSKQ